MTGLKLAPVAGAGLLFDIDGTLVDTDALHLQAFNEVFAPFGHGFGRDSFVTDLQGLSNEAISGRFLANETTARRAEVMEAKEAAFRRIAQAGLHPAPGLLALMEAADAAGLPMAAVTNAPRLNAVLMLDALGIRERFKAIVIGEELPRSKPHPLPYLEGLRLIGAKAEYSVAFEDSRAGIAAASAAGLPTIGLLTGLTEAESMAAGAAMTVMDFTSPALLEFVARRVARA